MNSLALSPQALLHLLVNAPRALDVVRTAYEQGLLARLDGAAASLGELCAEFAMLPPRLYKFLDCLESLGLVVRVHDGDDIEDTRYRGKDAHLAAERVLGPASIERDREKFGWQHLHGRLPEVLSGAHAMPADAFTYPPATPAQLAEFEASMAAGVGPAVEAFVAHGAELAGCLRLLDVGGGDGTLASALLRARPGLAVDVFNLPAARALVEATAAREGLEGRLGFVGGDFLNAPLPAGYDAISFVRVLHDWPDATARMLLRAAYEALEPGGLLLVCEEFRTADRLAAQFFWSYFLQGVDSCVSRLRDTGFYLAALAQAGFTDTAVLPGRFELIRARKPG